jgi:hypothetical protein
MDLDGSISTEVAIIAKKQEYYDIVTWGLADRNDGKPVPSWASSVCGLIPKGAKNVDVAKDFLKYLIQPKICNEYLKTGARPPRSGDAVARKERPVADGGPAPQGIRDAGFASPDRAGVLGLGLNSGLCPCPE